MTELSLKKADFKKLDDPGFNPMIRISQSMAYFKGYVYIGTGRNFLYGPGGKAGAGSARKKKSNEDPTVGAQIWRLDMSTGAWLLVYNSPVLETDDGDMHARDRSIRSSLIMQGPDDSGEALYFAIGSLEKQVTIVRTIDGEHFEECGEPGLGQGDVDIASVRSLTLFHDRVYTSPVGKSQGRGLLDDNMTDFPMVYETANLGQGQWVAVSEPRFGDPDNAAVNEVIAFNDHLYAATINMISGFQVWKTKAQGDPPYSWTKILDQGAYRGLSNGMPAAMFVFNDQLLLGSGLQRQGGGGVDAFGPIAPELIRINPDDSWDLIAGTPRLTPDGLKQPLSGLGPGFGNPFLQAFWRMIQYEGFLYIGTCDWRFFPTFLARRPGRTRDDLAPEQLQNLRRQSRQFNGDFELWKSRDGVSWEAVTTTGLGDHRSHNYGVREMCSTPHGVFLAPASSKEASAGGGLEIWHAVQ